MAALMVNALLLGTRAGLPRRWALCMSPRAHIYVLQRHTRALTGPGWSTMQPMICRMIGCVQAGHPGATPCSCWAAARAPYGGSPAADCLPELRGALGLSIFLPFGAQATKLAAACGQVELWHC